MMIAPELISRAMLVLSIMIAAISASPAAETGDLSALREKALALVNRERRERGLEPLSPGNTLNKAAQAHAEDMLRRNYYAHVSPEGDTVMDRYVDAGGSRWRLTAENIARCSGCGSPPTLARVESLHEGWMDSPTHRENILRRGLDRFGFGIVAGPEETLYAVQTFSGAGMPRGAQPGEQLEAIGADQQTRISLQRINSARRENDRSPLEAAPALIGAASNLLPPSGSQAAPDLAGDLAAVLPADGRHAWRRLAAIAGRCGGCGAQPTAADVRSFVAEWLDDPGLRERLLGREFTHLGLAVQANGDGLKTAIAVLGEQR